MLRMYQCVGCSERGGPFVMGTRCTPHALAAVLVLLWELRCSNVLVGNDLVDWMLQQPWCRSREHAEAIGQRLLHAGFIHHVTHAHPFRDKALFYRLRDATPGGPGEVILNAAERSASEYVREMKHDRVVVPLTHARTGNCTRVSLLCRTLS